MHILGCLDVPTSGRYWLNGHLIGDESEKKLADVRCLHIGFVFQSFYLLPKLTAEQNVEVPMIYAGVSDANRRKRALELLDEVGLADHARHFPYQMSGGQQQRVAIARALANHPAVLLADEPTGALDQANGIQVMKLFHTLNEQGNTIIMITHDSKIARHASRTVHILDGTLHEGSEEGKNEE